jgi:hypothetical protein
MRLFATCLVALLALQPGPAARSEDALNGPKRTFSDDLIENLTGDWIVNRQIRGRIVQNTLHAEWVLDHQFLQLHMKDVAEPSAYEAIVLIGYNDADRRYVAHWTDTFGGTYSAIGHGRRSGDSIEFVFAYPDGPFFNTFTWYANARRWVMRLENSGKGGDRKLFAIDTAERK